MKAGLRSPAEDVILVRFVQDAVPERSTHLRNAGKQEPGQIEVWGSDFYQGRNSDMLGKGDI